MATLSIVTKSRDSINDKPGIYFTCHPGDFKKYFEVVVGDIIELSDAVIYYTEDMTEPFSEEELSLGIGEMQLLVVPITHKLLSTPNRAMDVDIQFAKRAGMRILPIMMEEGLDDLYSDPGKFGNRQYINPNKTDDSAISYEQRLSEYIADVTIDTDLLSRVREAFDTRLFLSYRKKDRVYANTLMKSIHGIPEFRDVAIWYDEYIRLGEDFRENIDTALKKSELFLLLVTPSILEDPNFVKDEEYKMANGKKPILPVEMVPTDKAALSLDFENIPECAKMDNEEIRVRIMELLPNGLDKSKDNDPEHLYLIGIAYFYGIDMEVDRERGLSMLRTAADMGYPAANDFIFDYHRDNAEYDAALPYAKRLYDHYFDSLGKNDYKTLRAATTLASAYLKNSLYDKALELGEESLYGFYHLFGNKDERALNSMNTLAEIYTALGQFDEAIGLYEKAHGILCEKYGKDHVYSINGAKKLYKACAEAGYHQRALEINKDTYDNCKKVYSEVESGYILVALDLSKAYKAVEDYNNALCIAEGAFNVAIDTYGKAHPITLAADGAVVTLAAHFKKTDPRLAIKLYTRSYLLYCEAFGEDAKETLDRLLCICSAYDAAGDASSVAKHMEKYYKIHCRYFGNDDPRSLRAATLFAKSLYYDAKNAKDAIKIAKQTYTLQCNLLGNTHGDALETATMLVMFYYESEGVASALKFCEKVYGNCRKSLGDDHPKSIDFLKHLAKFHYIKYNYRDAIPLFERLLEHCSAKLENGSKEETDILLYLADCYVEENNVAAAILSYQKAYGILLKTRGPSDTDTIEARDRIRTLTGKWPD